MVNPAGHVYIMQSASRHVDADLTLDKLPTLGQRLQLPEGWEYRTPTLDKDLVVRARRGAHRPRRVREHLPAH